MAEYKMEKKESPDWGTVDVLSETYESGKPQGEEQGRWEQKLLNRQEKLKFIEEGLRYWYSKEGFGSEKRKTPA